MKEDVHNIDMKFIYLCAAVGVEQSKLFQDLQCMQNTQIYVNNVQFTKYWYRLFLYAHNIIRFQNPI